MHALVQEHAYPKPQLRSVFCRNGGRLRCYRISDDGCSTYMLNEVYEKRVLDGSLYGKILGNTCGGNAESGGQSLFQSTTTVPLIGNADAVVVPNTRYGTSKRVRDSLAVSMSTTRFEHVSSFCSFLSAPLHPSYYGVTFLLPKYFKAISSDSDDSKYILSIVLGLVFCPGA